MKALNDLSRKIQHDPVWDVWGGIWKVVARQKTPDESTIFPLIIERDGRTIPIDYQGRTDPRLPPTFFAEPVKLTPFNAETAVDWEAIPIDTLVEWKSYDLWIKAYFAGYVDGGLSVFPNGATSVTNIGKPKLVKPSELRLVKT